MKQELINAVIALSLAVLLLDALRGGSYAWAVFGLLAVGAFFFVTYIRQ